MMSCADSPRLGRDRSGMERSLMDYMVATRRLMVDSDQVTGAS